MKLEQKAKQYSEAIFNVASETSSEKKVNDSLSLLSVSIKSLPELRSFLLSRRVSSPDKSKAIQAIFSDKCHLIIIEFIAMIEKENIVKLIPLLEKYYSTLLFKNKNVVNVTADIAQDIDESRKNEFKSMLDKALNKNSELSFHVNPKLLGGIRLRVGNELIDASLKNHLNKLRHKMLGAK
jgi:F-type H+-transporting ATPase subunit delta